MEARQKDVGVNASLKNIEAVCHQDYQRVVRSNLRGMPQVACKQILVRCTCCSWKTYSLHGAAAVGFHECNGPKAITTPHRQAASQSCRGIQREHLLASLAQLCAITF